MNRDKLVQPGRLPWSPVSAAVDLDVWHEHEVPLVGTYRLEEQVVLFTVVGDSSDDLTVWAYRCLSADEAATAEELSFDSVGELREHVEGLFVRREAVFALASDLIIEKWTPADIEDGLLSAAVTFLKGIVTATAPDPLTAFRRAVAEVESVRSDLIDA